MTTAIATAAGSAVTTPLTLELADSLLIRQNLQLQYILIDPVQSSPFSKIQPFNFLFNGVNQSWSLFSSGLLQAVSISASYSLCWNYIFIPS
jgi:hypothetical protein